MTRIPDRQLARDWQARLKRFDQADLTIAEFCRREGYSTASFYQWRRKLRESPVSSGPAFVPVDLGDEAIQSVDSQACCRIELPGGAVLTFPAHADFKQQCDLIAAIVQATAGEVPA